MTQEEYINSLEKLLDKRSQQVSRALNLAENWQKLYEDYKAKYKKLEELVGLQKETIALLEEKCDLLECKGS